MEEGQSDGSQLRRIRIVKPNRLRDQRIVHACVRRVKLVKRIRSPPLIALRAPRCGLLKRDHLFLGVFSLARPSLRGHAA